jgi:hypothetical protein
MLNQLNLARLLTPLLVLLVVVGCGEDDRPDRRLLDASEEPALDAEAERLRKMQAITVFNTVTGKNEETNPVDLLRVDEGIGDSCKAALGSCQSPAVTCADLLCSAAHTLCLAKTFLALTKPQATPPAFGSWTFPLQAPSVNVELAKWAKTEATSAADEFAHQLEAMSGSPRSSGDLCSASDATVNYRGKTGAQFVAGGFKEAYDVYRAAVDQTIQSALDTSDAELSSSTSPILAGERAIVNWRLGLAGFAAGGTAQKLPFGASGGFCTTGTPSAQVRAAIAVFRDAALPPGDIVGTTSTSVLLNGTTLLPPEGSVRQRLAQFRGKPELNDTAVVPKLEDYLNISLHDFESARKILQEEIAAFSRTDAALPLRKLATGSTATIKSWAGTAAPPSRLPAAYYGALARTNDTTQPTLTHAYSAGNQIDSGYVGLNTDLEKLFGASRYLNSITNNLASSVRDAASAPIAMLLAGGDHLGHVTEVMDNNGVYRLEVFGPIEYRTRVVAGEAALRCAVDGTVEGVPCQLSSAGSAQTGLPIGTYQLLSYSALTSEEHYGLGFGHIFQSTASAEANARGWERLYLLAPKPSAGTVPGPGQFDALIGVTVVKNKPKTYFSIVRGMEDRFAQLLEPSRDTCARPRLNCDGVEFDERIPLEDELTSDEDSVESSWRHYLDLATAAAQKADELGVDYIQSGLSSAERIETVEIRQQQQDQLANSHLQRLQAICGTEADTRALLDQLKDAAGEKLQATGGSCTVSSDCTAGHQGWRCLNNRCTIDLSKVLSQLGSSDPSIQRLQSCLSESSTTPFISLGDAPLCLWRDVANSNLLCRGAKPGQCPFVKPADKTCAQAVLIPSGVTGVMAEQSLPLGFFAMRDDPGPDNEELAIWNDIANGALSPQQWPTKGPAIIASNVLDPIRLEGLAERLGWEARFGGFAALTYDSVPIYQTGSAGAGPETSTWPCATGPTVSQPYPIYPTAALDCSNLADRMEANGRLHRAMLAAKSMAPTNEYSGVALHSLFYPEDCTGDVISRESQVFHTGIGVTKTTYATGTSYATTNTTIPPFGLGTAKNCFRPGVGRVQMSLFVDRPTAGLSMVYPAGGRRSILARYLTENLPGFPDRYTVANDDNPHEFDDPRLSVLDYLTAIGVLAQRAGAAPSIDLSQPLTINTVEDMEKAAQWVTTLAAAIRAATGKSLFANMPDKVRDALRAESATGAYPEFGGEMAEALSFTRGALLRIRENGPLVANEVQQLGYDIREAKIMVQKAAMNQELAKLQLLSTLQNQITACTTSMAAIPGIEPVSALGRTGVAALTCANSLAQMDFARDIAELSKGQAGLDNDLALIQFGAKFSTRATTLQTLSLNLAEAQEDLDGSLARIEKLRVEAAGQVINALYASSEQARSQAGLSRSIGSLHAGKQIRYQAALSNARHMAFLAKRAIEQRLGIRLADMTEDMPLVEAPQSWEAAACTFTGVNYAALAATDDSGPRSYAGGFIGDYVDKLESVVESYRLVNNFHEGKDTAVISLRDDIMNVRAKCSVEGANLLYDAGQLDRTLSPGWSREGCPTTVVEGVTVPQTGCVDVTALDNPGPTFGDPATSTVKGYTLAFGADVPNAAVLQSFELNPGSYRFTWYTEGALTGGGAQSGQVWADAGVVTQGASGPTSASMTNWYRRYVAFTVSKPGLVKVGFRKPSTGTVTVAAPMLERLPPAGAETQGLVPFVNTGANLEQVQPACDDRHGAIFRSTRWTRSCQKLCPNGFGDDCVGAESKSFCYWQSDFNINQNDLQLGRVLNYSGFARGNYNYRIDSIALNVIGTPRDCSDSPIPQSCYGGGFVPYSLSHLGPFVVRNHEGDDVPARVFDGNIEHARALASERYITNPLSDSDNSLLQQYARLELRGRPLDGTFVLKIWEEPGVDFSAIEDVQVILNYRYWTKFD